ncbi:hypothetical protein ACTHQ8_05570 [Lysinibacillus odysseyi]
MNIQLPIFYIKEKKKAIKAEFSVTLWWTVNNTKEKDKEIGFLVVRTIRSTKVL